MQAERNRKRLPPKRDAYRWARRIAGLLATAAFLGAGVAIALMVMPDNGAEVDGRRGWPRPRATAKPREEEDRQGKKASKPKGPTKAQLATRKDAVDDRARRGLHDAQAERLRLQGDAARADRPPGRRLRRRPPRVLLQQGDASSATTRTTPVDQAQRGQAGQGHGHARPTASTPPATAPASRAAASGCASGSRAACSTAGHDPARRRPLPAPPVTSAPSARDEEDSGGAVVRIRDVVHAAAGRHDRRQPRPHDRAVRATARRSSPSTRTCATRTRSSARPSTARRARSSPPGSSPATASGSGARTAPSGRSSSTRRPRPGSSSSTSTRPTGRPSSSTCCASPAAGCWSRRPRSRPPTTSQMVDDVRDNLDGLEQVVFIGRDWEEFIAGGERVSADELRAAPGRDPVRRPDQHPVHERHHGLPQGRHAQPPQHPQQRLLRRPRAAATPRQDRVCIPVPYYHCFGMVMGNLACTSHGACMVIPAPAFDPVATLQAVQDESCTSLYGVPTMFIAELEHPEFGEFDLSQPAHRDHGRLAVPDRDDAPRRLARCTWRRSRSVTA